VDLFRPVGLKELELIAAAGFVAFPPRLPHQPIFYPVLDLEYARQIARDWNAPDEFSGFVGFVTTFVVEDSFARRYPIQVAGASRHRELWVPAEDLPQFNAAIVNQIRVTEAYPGPRFTGRINHVTNLPAHLVPG
jgi:hypothetical protein